MISGNLSFSICIPVYRGSELLVRSLDSIFRQDFGTYEIIIGDDNYPEDIEEIEKTRRLVSSFKDSRIRLIKNGQNLGCGRNLRNIVSKAQKDIIFLLGQDDVLSKDSLQKTHDAFFLAEDIGVVTRPYFWFYDDFTKPVRAVLPYDEEQDSVISIFDGKREFAKIFESVGQCSGLAYMRRFLEVPFNEEVFPTHIYPFAGILRDHKCVFLKDYTVAVGIKESQTRNVPSIYDLSPTESWLKMYRTVFRGDKFRMQRKWGVECITSNYVGLVQLKNFAKSGCFTREVLILIKHQPKNLCNLRFLALTVLVFITPKFILIRLVDWYKRIILARRLKGIKFNF